MAALYSYSLLCTLALAFVMPNLFTTRVAFAKRILVVPFANVSHTLIMEAVMRRLAARGHEVTVLWANDFHMPIITRNPQHNYQLVEFSLNTSHEEFQTIQDAVQHELMSEARSNMDIDTGLTARVLHVYEQLRALVSRSSLVANSANKLCRQVLSDGRLMATLRERRFDIALVDDFFFSRCVFLVPHVLNIPYVSVGETSSWWDMRLPALPSAFIGPEESNVTIATRTASLIGILAHLIVPSLPSYFCHSPEVLREANVSLDEYLALPSRSALFLYLWDNLMTGFTLPKLPHVEFIGGLTAGPSKSLDQGTEVSRNLKAWADRATGGFVVCSFGTVLVAPNDYMLEKLFELFAGLKLPVVFKLNSEHAKERPGRKFKLPANVLLMDWLPQNDLLGHPNARLFITHAGTNGYAEGLYHGVPLLAFPFILPQRFMAERLEALGFGRMASFVTMTGAELAALGTELLNDKRYRERVQQVSRVIRARKHPAEAAADAVEHILQFGSDHLRPHAAYQLNFFQFYMLDVLFAIFLLLSGSTIFILSILSCLVRRVLCSKKGMKQQRKPKAD